jgi:hypothetical protein
MKSKQRSFQADRLQRHSHIDVFMEDGYTKEEWKMMVETKKILDPKIKLTCDVRARAGLRRPFGSRQHRVRKSDHRG